MFELLFALFIALSSPTNHHPITNSDGTVQVQSADDGSDDGSGDDGGDETGDLGHLPPPPPPPPHN